jgi:hypothetical protein
VLHSERCHFRRMQQTQLCRGKWMRYLSQWEDCFRGSQVHIYIGIWVHSSGLDWCHSLYHVIKDVFGQELSTYTQWTSNTFQQGKIQYPLRTQADSLTALQCCVEGFVLLHLHYPVLLFGGVQWHERQQGLLMCRRQWWGDACRSE